MLYQTMFLTKLHTNILIVGCMTYMFIACLIPGQAMNLMSVASILAFITQVILLFYFSHEDDCTYSETSLFYTILIYSTLLGLIFMGLSYYYDGDSFLFSKVDALCYYEESIMAADMGLTKGIKYLINRYPYDDWGAMVFDTCLMSIIPNKLFLNSIYLCTGAISSIWLFRMGKYFMPKAYAYMATLAYGTSSYMAFFHCSYLKESIFVFMVIGTLYHYNNFINRESRSSFFIAISFIILILFFRPAVSAFLIFATATFYIYTRVNYAKTFILVLILLGIFMLSISELTHIIRGNTAGGNLDAILRSTNNSNYSYSFNYFMSFIGSIAGPFPALFIASNGNPSWLQFYGAGLLYKLFLVCPFWFGIYYIIQKRNILFMPITLFVLTELIATACVCASMELRKVIIHVPFMYLIAFYGIYQYKNQHIQDDGYPYYNYLIVVAIVFLWNIIRIK